MGYCTRQGRAVVATAGCQSSGRRTVFTHGDRPVGRVTALACRGERPHRGERHQAGCWSRDEKDVFVTRQPNSDSTYEEEGHLGRRGGRLFTYQGIDQRSK